MSDAAGSDAAHPPHLERTLAPSPFPGDDGLADPAARRAMAAAVRDPGPTTYLRAVAVLCTTRVLVPVVATATRVGTTADGLTGDKEADMSVVMLEAGDGRRALLGFTGLDALKAWRPDARPVPVTLDLAAKTARAEGVDTVLVDVAGPHPLAVDGEVLDALALGHRLVELEPGEFGWAVTVADPSA
ncbi:MAG TPA: SseB family protein [Friedmanniella sp.]